MCCETKKCSNCKLDLSLDNFSKNKTIKGGLQYNCKKCAILISREYYKNNRKKQIQICSKNSIKYKENLSNCYVKKTLVVNNKNLNYKDISPELIELQRENLKLKRKIKEINKQINN